MFIKDPFTGNVQGPFSQAKLKELAKNGQIDGGWEVAKSNNGPWMKAGRIKGLVFGDRLDEEDDWIHAPATPPSSTNPPAFGQQANPLLKNVPPVINESVLPGLFDFQFKKFIYPNLVKLVYKIFTWLWAILIILGGVVIELNLIWQFLGLFKGDFQSALGALAGLVIFPFVLFLYWLLIQGSVRSAFEIALVLFSINDTLKVHTNALEKISSKVGN